MARRVITPRVPHINPTRPKKAGIAVLIDVAPGSARWTHNQLDVLKTEYVIASREHWLTLGQVVTTVTERVNETTGRSFTDVDVRAALKYTRVGSMTCRIRFRRDGDRLLVVVERF